MATPLTPGYSVHVAKFGFAHIKPAGLVLPPQVTRFRFDRAAGKHDYFMRISWC